MQMTAQKITPCLWFDTQAEEAAKFYASVFKNSKIGKISRYGKEGFEIHGKKAGTVMTAEFEIEGQKFLALNGGPQFKFNEAVSFQVHCENQQEIDYFWSALAEGGEEGPCGWLKDKFGLSWQVIPPGAAADADGREFRQGATGHAVDVADAQDRPRGPATGASRLNLATASSQQLSKGKDHASDTVSVLRRPLRGGDRVLQEGARRRGRDDDALQGKPGAAAARHGAARQRQQGHARVPAHQRRRR